MLFKNIHTLLQKGRQILENCNVAEEMGGYKVCVCGEAEWINNKNLKWDKGSRVHSILNCVFKSTNPPLLPCSSTCRQRGSRDNGLCWLQSNTPALCLQSRSYWSILVTMQIEVNWNFGDHKPNKFLVSLDKQIAPQNLLPIQLLLCLGYKSLITACFVGHLSQSSTYFHWHWFRAKDTDPKVDYLIPMQSSDARVVRGGPC